MGSSASKAAQAYVAFDHNVARCAGPVPGWLCAQAAAPRRPRLTGDTLWGRDVRVYNLQARGGVGGGMECDRVEIFFKINSGT